MREEKLRPPRRAWWQRLLQRSWRDKFQRNLRAAGLLLEEVSAAGTGCAGSIPEAERGLP